MTPYRRALQKWGAALAPSDRSKLKTVQVAAFMVMISALLPAVLSGRETEAKLAEYLRIAAKATKLSDHAIRVYVEFIRAELIAENHASGGAPFQGELPK